MSKVICDVCGTTYPETATQCPICGSAKNNAEQTIAGSVDGMEDSASYAYVKGGRFSKKNVRRRERGGSTPVSTAQRRSGGSSRRVQEDEESSNIGLVIVVILLLIAIAAVVIYLILPFFKSEVSDPKETTGSPVQTTEPSEPSFVRIPCTEILLSNAHLELEVGATWTLTTQLAPVDTTDTVAFVSRDPAIASVDPNSGLVTMLAEGETVITAICGEITAECTVKTPAGGGDDPVTPGEFKFEFNTRFTDDKGNGDVSLTKQGATWKAYTSSLDIDPTLILWTSDNPEIAKIDNGIVTAVAPGTTKVHAQYNGVTYSCIIRCSFEVREDANDCAPNLDDVTISVGQSFTLKLLDANGYKLDVTWLCDTDGVTIDGTKITGAVSGNHTVYTVYEEKTYTCIVRVK